MKIKSVRRITLDEPEPVYDVVNAGYNHNFFIKTSEGSYIVAHNCGILDEVDFVKGASIHMEQSKVMNMYRSVKRRMESRYARNGTIPGILFLVSSKKSEHDFLEQYVRTQRDNPYILIVDEPLWKVKPSSNYSGRYFKIAIGNNYVKSRILGPTDDAKSLEQQGFRILDVPVEHRQAFELDIDSALMDIAGVSVASASKFIAYDRLRLNYTDRINPFKNEILTIGLDDNLDIKDFFVPDLVSDSIRSQPGFIHLDLSLTGDRTGISLVTIEGTKQVKQYNKVENEVRIEDNVDLVYRQVFTIGIQAPANSEISLEKTRQFIYYLKSIGFNIQGISADGFQSADMLQQLKIAGFNTKLISLDRSPAGYLAFRAAINEERLNLLDLSGSTVEDELVNLEQDGMSGKVDHPSCFTGDTKIRLVDGRSLTIDELMIEQTYRDNYVYTINERTGHVEAKKISKVFQSGITSDLVEIYLDNGQVVTCTPEHLFMTRDGSYAEAQNLQAYDSLMPLYTKYPDKGLSDYRMVYDPADECWHYEHHLFCRNNKVKKRQHVVHHCNYNKDDNTPDNLMYISKSLHTKINNCSTRDYTKVSNAVKAYHKRAKGTEEYAKRSEAIRRGMKKYFDENGLTEKWDQREKDYQEKIKNIEKMYDVVWDELTTNEKNSYGVKYYRATHPGQASEAAKKFYATHMFITNDKETRTILKTDPIPDGWRKGRRSVKNHKVVAVKRIHKPSRVYDLTIEDNHNFSLDAGIFVHNSGCVTGDTLIRLSDGSVETVDDLLDNYRGKSVITINEETLEREVKPIENVFFTKVTDKICKLVLNTNELVQCTPDHRFMLKDGSWIEAQYLTIDDELMTLDGDVKVISNYVVEDSVSVYDLTIKDNHNYPLKSGIISHNSKDLADGLCGAIYHASLSGVSTSIRYAADDASVVNDIMIADNEFIEDLNSMLDLGPSTRVVEEESGVLGSSSDDSLLDYLYDDMVW